MKKYLLPILASFLTLVLFAGCESTGSSARIQEKAAVFAALPPEQQKDIKAGVIEVGYTADMVYMALGKPSKVDTKDTPDGPVGMWTFSKYYPTNATVKMMAAQHSMAYAPPMVSANQKWRGGFVGPGFGSAPPGNYGPQQSLEPGDLQADTLYVMFYKGHVFDIKLESQGG